MLGNTASEEPKVISVQHLRILDSGDIDIIFSNQSRYHYDSRTLHQWVMKPKFIGGDQLQKANEDRSDKVLVEPILQNYEGSIQTS